MSELIDPTNYSFVWWLVFALLAVLFVGWILAIPMLTRKRVAGRYADLVPDTTPPLTLREIYSAHINELSEQLNRFAISERTMHLELSRLVREYVGITTGIATKTMTYSDLEADPRTQPMAEVIAQCYHPAFSSDGSLDGWTPADPEQPITVQNALWVVNSL